MPTLKPTPTLKDIQMYVEQTAKERGFDASTITQRCLLLGEEVGELYKAIRKSHGKLGLATHGYDAQPQEELADILLLVCSIANSLDLDLEQAFRYKEIKNNQRTWK